MSVQAYHVEMIQLLCLTARRSYASVAITTAWCIGRRLFAPICWIEVIQSAASFGDHIVNILNNDCLAREGIHVFEYSILYCNVCFFGRVYESVTSCLSLMVKPVGAPLHVLFTGAVQNAIIDLEEIFHICFYNFRDILQMVLVNKKNPSDLFF